MDPSIMKLLEEDEDETMHSGADVDAFTAALNRDIEGDGLGDSHSAAASDSAASGSFTQESNQISGAQQFSHWQSSNQNKNGDNQSQQVPNVIKQEPQQPSELMGSQHGTIDENRRDANAAQMPVDVDMKPKIALEPVHDKTDLTSLNFHQASSMQASGSAPSQTQGLGKMQIRPKMPNMQNNPVNSGRQIPFGSLLPLILPELDDERSMQLQALYNKLRRSEVDKDTFVRSMKSLVGDQMLKLAVVKIHAKSTRMVHAGPSPLQSQSAIHQPLVRPSPPSIGQFTDLNSFSQPLRMGQITPSDSSSGNSMTMQGQNDSVRSVVDGNAKRSREGELLSNSQAMQAIQMQDRTTNSMQGLTKMQQQHFHFPPNSLPIDGSSNSNPYPATNVNAPTKLLKQPYDIPMRQAQHHQGLGLTQLGGQTKNMMSGPMLEKQNVPIDSNKLPSGSFPQRESNVAMQQDRIPWQAMSSNEQRPGSFSSGPYVKREPVDQTNDHHAKVPLHSSQGPTPNSFGPPVHEQGNALHGASTFESSRTAFSTSISTPPISAPGIATPINNFPQVSSQIPSSGAIVGPLNTAKAPPKKPAVGQKKPLDTSGSSPPPSSKKQKVAAASMDQSIEHLNDVTAVSGVNLREEEEQLFSGPKDGSRISEASRRVVQEEEEKLLLQKVPLQRKLAEIISKCGLKNLSNDVERCLSLCVEERLRGLISNLIRVSKQRVDSEKSRHRTIITSDVRQQILVINRKAKEEWDKKLAEAEKLRKLSEPESSSSGVESDKDEGGGKSTKNLPVNKDEDDKMRTTAANVAARAAVGGDDMLSKWQLMAEQAKQKREGGAETASSSQVVKDANRKPLTTSVRNQRDNRGAGKRESSAASGSSGAGRLLGSRDQVPTLPPKVARNISVRDVIAVLERESQMTKSTALYRLYERIRNDSTGE
ncbi:hypothetical protein Droror1_Dr00002172 [Drosera rotundifolia]